MALKISSIVTVVLEDSIFHDKQAEIVEIVADEDEDGPIGVKFGRDGENLLGFCRNESEKIIRFKECELREDKDWTSLNKAYKLFGPNMWHHLSTIKKRLNLKKNCEHEDCNKKVTSRIMVNAWGVVCEYDVCETHRKEYHGKCVDVFPCKN